jgi:hypothetical protein
MLANKIEYSVPAHACCRFVPHKIDFAPLDSLSSAGEGHGCRKGREVRDYGPQAARHHAIALVFAEQYELALQQARYVAESNPDNMVFQTTPLTVLYNTPGAEQEALKEIARIRSQFRLDAEGEKSLVDAGNAGSGSLGSCRS